MRTSSESRISELVADGHWGDATLHGLLAQHARLRPRKPAVKDAPNRGELIGGEPLALNWGELEVASENLAGQLQQAGVAEEERLIVQLPNVVELLVLYYAVSKLGAILSPVPMQYGEHELQSVAAALGAGFLITVPAFRGEATADKAGKALPEVPLLQFGCELTIQKETVEHSCTHAPQDADRVLTICWTSGTTGTPKGVPRSHNMWLATGKATATAGHMHPDDVLLNPFPLVNMASLGGFVFPAALLSCAIVLHHPLDPALFLQQLQDEAVTFTIAPPALLNQLAKSPDMWNRFDFGALRRIGSGSAPLAPWMIETFERDYGKQIVNFYGSNEGIALFSTPETAPEPEVRASMFPVPAPGGGISAKVADPATGLEITESGAPGELLISGSTVFDGYYDPQSENDQSEVFSADGFFRSGDLVELCGDDASYYRIVGRCKDIINRGGMKISPAELDIALEQHPDLVEAAVCAYADERLGEKICACVVPQNEGVAITVAGLQEYLLGQSFAKFKLPERVEYFDALPRNPLGKVQRFALQEAVAARKETTV